MCVSFFALHVSVTRLTIIRGSMLHPGVQWRGTKSNVSRKQATGQGKVVQKHYIWRAGGSRARNIEPLMMVSLVTETCRAKKDTHILMFLE